MVTQNEFVISKNDSGEHCAAYATSTPRSDDGDVHDRSRAEHHIRQVVMPLLRQVAEAAHASGRYGIAAVIVARAKGGAQPNREPFVAGAFLGLAQRQPGWEEDYGGIIRIAPAGGSAFTLTRKVPAFYRMETVPIEELGELRIIEAVREVMAGAFK